MEGKKMHVRRFWWFW